MSRAGLDITDLKQSKYEDIYMIWGMDVKYVITAYGVMSHWNQQPELQLRLKCEPCRNKDYLCI